jgi:hypothetical protein
MNTLPKVGIMLGLNHGVEFGTHICFIPGPSNKKTFTWSVETKEEWLIGSITWYGPWRCYAFTPRSETVFEKTCLREIADFCERKTKEHKLGVRP